MRNAQKANEMYIDLKMKTSGIEEVSREFLMTVYCTFSQESVFFITRVILR